MSSACSSTLAPPYGYYVRLWFGKGQTVSRDLTLSQQNKNFRTGNKGRLKYLGWDRQILGAEYSRSSQYSSQGRSWPTGIPYSPPRIWYGSLILSPPEWDSLNDMFTLQQDSMKPGKTEQDILLYDHRIQHREATPILRPEFDNLGAIANAGTYQYWAVFRTELTKVDLVEMHQNPASGAYRYLVDVELKERLPPLTALP
jgi:hypothetical protein